MSPLNIPRVSATPKGIIQQTDLGAGLTLKSNRFLVPLNMMQVLTNWVLVEDGSLIGRRGTLLWNATPVGSGQISGATRAYLTTNCWLVASGTQLYQGTDGPQTFASVLTGLTNNSLAWFVQYLNYCYFSNKNDAPKKSSDGTTWTNMGLSAPGSAPTAADSGSAGTPNGTYTFEVTFSSATVESNPSAASNSVTVTSHTINLTSIPVSADTQVTSRVIYGFKTGVSSTYQRIGTIADNTTTTFTVTTDQGSWTTAPPSDHYPPTTGAWITVEWKNRLWKAGDPNLTNRLYFSQIFIPEAWPATFFVDIPFDKGDFITGLFVLGDLLLVFGNNSVFYVFGDTPFSFVIKQSFAQAGCPSPWAIDRVENAALYLSRFGVYAFDGAYSRLLTDPIDPQFTGLFPQFTAVNYSGASRATMRYYDRLKALVLSVPTTPTANDTTYWYFLKRQAWVKDSRVAQQFIVDDGAGGLGNLYAWDAAAGNLRQWDTTYVDDGAAITAEFKTGVLAGDNPLATKIFQWYTLRAQPSNATVNVTATLDQGADSDSFTVPLARGAVYGTAIYGTSMYASGLDTFDERFATNCKGQGIEIDATVVYKEFIRIAAQFISYQLLPTIRRRVGATP